MQLCAGAFSWGLTTVTSGFAETLASLNMTSARGVCLVPWSRDLSVNKETERSNRLLGFLLLCFLEQAHQLIFPESRNCVTAVTAGFVAQRNQHCAALWHALDFVLQYPELRGVDHIVGRIDGEEWRVDFFKVGARIVIVRRFDRGKHIIRVTRFQVVGNEFVQHLVSLCAGRCFFLS